MYTKYLDTFVSMLASYEEYHAMVNAKPTINLKLYFKNSKILR